MRESIGGTWLLGFVVTFIVLFASFLAYAISYTKAFNMKSEILNLIERSEGYTNSSNQNELENMSSDALKDDPSVEAQAFLLIKNSGYNYQAAMDVDCSKYGHKGQYAMKTGGYCVTKYCPGKQEIQYDDGTSEVVGGTDSKTYYKVTTFISMKLPILEVTMSIPVSGETRTLFFDQSNDSDCIKYAD